MSRTEKTEGLLSAQPKPSPAPTAPTATGKKPNWGCWCLGGCLAIPLVLIVGVASVGAYVAAKAGIANIPVFSLAYKEHQPLRAVAPDTKTVALFPVDAFKSLEGLDQPGADPEAALNNLFNDENVQAFFSNLEKTAGSATGRLSFELTEGMLTASLRQAAAAAPQTTGTTKEGEPEQPFDLTRAQIAISEQKGVEVFLPLKNNPQNTAVRIYLRPSLADGALTVSLLDVWVGNLRVPPSWVESLDRDGIQEAFRSAAPGMKEHLELKSVTVKEGAVKLEGRFLQ